MTWKHDTHKFQEASSAPTHKMSTECWCKPRIEHICDECEGDNSICWKCKGIGWVECKDPACIQDNHVVIHNLK